MMCHESSDTNSPTLLFMFVRATLSVVCLKRHKQLTVGSKVYQCTEYKAEKGYSTYLTVGSKDNKSKEHTARVLLLYLRSDHVICAQTRSLDHYNESHTTL